MRTAALLGGLIFFGLVHEAWAVEPEPPRRVALAIEGRALRHEGPSDPAREAELRARLRTLEKHGVKDLVLAPVEPRILETLPAAVDIPGSAELAAAGAGWPPSRARQRASVDQAAGAFLVALEQAERQSDALFGRPVPQIVRLGGSGVVSVLWDVLLDRLLRSGRRIVSVEEALADAAYEGLRPFERPGLSPWAHLAAEKARAVARNEIEALMARQAADWSAGRIREFCAPYAEDALFLSPSGLTRGRAEIQARYEKKYPTPERMGRLSLEVVELRLFDVPGAGETAQGPVAGATVALRWTLRRSPGDEPSGLSLVSLAKGPTGWTILQDASM